MADFSVVELRVNINASGADAAHVKCMLTALDHGKNVKALRLRLESCGWGESEYQVEMVQLVKGLVCKRKIKIGFDREAAELLGSEVQQSIVEALDECVESHCSHLAHGADDSQ